MATYLQSDRFLTLTTPLGPDALLPRGFDGTEGISQLFHYRLDLMAEHATRIPFDQLLGQKVTIHLALEDGRRHFNGICSRIAEGGRDETFTSYRMEVVPEVWLLTRIARSRIFQRKSVPEILEEVLDGLSAQMQLQGTFHPRDYCVQYRETDFRFISRLMEEEGISYYFTHTDGHHQMVIVNTPQGSTNLPGPGTIEFQVDEAAGRRLDVIHSWEKVQEFRSGKSTLWDHCFEVPGSKLDASAQIIQSVQVGRVEHPMKIGNNELLELYDFPGDYAKRFDGVSPGGGASPAEVQKIFEDNVRTVGIRMQEEAAAGLVIHGAGHCRAMAAGHRFRLDGHFNADGEYLITGVNHTARLGGDYRSDMGGELNYENTFTCMPVGLPFRPARVTPRPIVQGTQTATVVGPAGEEIFTDSYGRVKVQFHWDREGANDEHSSCWVRVGSIWAGKNWGAIHIPRIGQEVVVAFEEGDPDCPIIVGGVYNADQMPPYELPGNKTRSGIKSRSTVNASPANFNEIRFEDKKDAEQIYVHAEKDFDRVVENNDTLKVGFEKKDKGDQSIDVFNTQTITVGCPQATDGSQITTVYKDRSATIETGNESVRIKMGNRDVTLDMGNDSLTLKMGNQTTKLTLGKSTTDALQSIELKVGQSSIKVDQMGVTIKGMMIKVEGTVQTQVKGLITQVNGDAMLQARGGITMIN